MAVHDQVRTGDIAAAVQAELDQFKYGIVEDLVGHGVGHELHEDPNIPNYGRAGTGPWLSSWYDHRYRANGHAWATTASIAPMITGRF